MSTDTPQTSGDYILRLCLTFLGIFVCGFGCGCAFTLLVMS